MCAVLFLCYNCSEEDFSDRYYDPSKVTSSTVEQIFTGVLEEAQEFLRLGYGRFFVHDPAFGIWAQTWGHRPDDDMYESSQMQVDGSYGRYIKVVTQHKVLKREVENSKDPSAYKSYELCGRAVMLHVMFQSLDEFGKLPYEEVGLFPLTGEIVLPHLDDTKTLYQKVLDELGEINDELAKGGNGVAASTDWLNLGDMKKWRIYVNSLRLRCAIRLSGANDYTNSDNDKAQAAKQLVATILNDPDKYPIVTGVADQIYVENNFSSSPDGWWKTITDHDGNANGKNWAMRCTAAEALLLRLDLNQDSLYSAAADDPRLPLIYDTIQGGPRSGKYVGVNPRDDYSVVSPLVSGAGADAAGIKQLSSLNERSFRDNRKVKGYVITPSEILFYKAEAILRGIVTAGDAKDAFKNAVLESVKMYAVVNAESDCAKEDFPTRSPRVAGAGTQWTADWTDANILSYADAKWEAATDKLKLVYEQFWVHNTIFNTVETFNSLRRTGIPDDLYYGYRSGSNSTKVLPNRVIIPGSEHERNPNIPNERSSVGYEKGKGNWEVIFWARDLTDPAQYKGTVKTSL